MSSLRKNYILSLISQIITVICPLLVAPFTARKLQVDNIGIFSYTESILFIFSLFALLGSNIYGQREIAYCQGDKRKQLQTFTEIFLSSSITTLIVLVGYIVFVLFQSKYQLIYWIQILELLAFHWDIGWFYLGKEDFKSLLYRNAMVKLLYVVLIFSFIRTPEDLSLYVLFRVGTFLLGGIALLFPVLTQCVKEKILPHFSTVPHHISNMIPLFIPQIAIQVYTVLDKTMIGIITQSPYQNGCYEEAMKVIRVLMNFVGSVAGVLMPRIAALHVSGNRDEIGEKLFNGIRFVCLITLPMIFGIAAVASIFMPWFLGPGYDDTVVLLQILVIILFLLGIGRVVGVCLLATKKENIYTRNVCIGAAVNFFLNLWLISCYQAKGAALASVAAELVVTSLMLYGCRKFLDFGKIVKNATLYLLCSVAMFGVLLALKNYVVCSSLWKLLILAAGGMTVYGVGLLLIKDDMILDTVKVLWKKRNNNSNL